MADGKSKSDIRNCVLFIRHPALFGDDNDHAANLLLFLLLLSPPGAENAEAEEKNAVKIANWR